MDTLQAAVLLVKLGFIDEWNAQRRALAENYRVLFEQAGLVEPGPYPQNGVVLPKTVPRPRTSSTSTSSGFAARPTEGLSPRSGEWNQRFTTPGSPSAAGVAEPGIPSRGLSGE
jgi:hypothetical protein